MTVLDFFLTLVALLALFTVLSIVVLSMIWLERKFLGRLQRRLGPTRTGPFGLLQPVADAVKLVLKEDLIPSWAEKAVFWVAPLVVLIPAFMIWVTIPAGKDLVLSNLNLGLFYIIAFAVVGILGLVLAGWGSANKYGALGGLRSAAQLISYEIPLIMVVIAVAMLAQSLDLRIISISQVPVTDLELAKVTNLNVPFVLLQPLGLAIFLVAGLAEVGRTPFDIYFAESEIVGGPFVEYSGAHWAVFFLAEYINTFAIAALAVLLFLGGWYGPINPTSPPWLAGLVALIWFLVKVYLVILVIFWIRGTLPRLRIDQLMAFAWKVVVPLSFANIVITAIYMFYGWPAWSLSLMSLVMLGAVGYALYRKVTLPVIRVARAYARQSVMTEQALGRETRS